MASYELLIAKKAVKEAESIQKVFLSKINVAIKALSSDPFPHGVKKLTGSNNSYRIRVADYRVIYMVEGRLIKVMSILHRREAYR